MFPKGICGMWYNEIMDKMNFSGKVYVYNVSDGRELYAKEAEMETEIASITKVMTALTFLDNTRNYDEKVKITPEMLEGLEEFVVVGLTPGQEVTIDDLLYAAMLPSAGDAAQALAVMDAGSIDKFVAKMNKKVHEMGLKHTHFSNVVGFDEENYSSAEDVARILQVASENEKLAELMESFDQYLPSLDVSVKKTFPKSEPISGGKTGFTYAAGRNLATYGEVNGAKLVVVDLNEPYTTNLHIENTGAIYQYYLENYSYQKILGTGDLVRTLAVKDSPTKEINLYAKEDVEKFLENGYDLKRLDYEYTGVTEITNKAKARMGDKLGDYMIKLGEEVLYSTELYLEEEIYFYPYWLFATLTGLVVAGVTWAILWKKRVRVNRNRRGR